MIKLETLLEKHPDDIDSTSSNHRTRQYYIVGNKRGNYSIPKGHMRKGETPREDEKRIKEETQLEQYTNQSSYTK